MISLQTIRRGARVAVWSPTGEIRFVDGPRRILLFRERIQPLQRYSAESHQYLAVRMRNGRTEHRRGPTDIWFNPIEHESITVENARKRVPRRKVSTPVSWKVTPKHSHLKMPALMS